MAYVDQSSAFGYGTQLTSTQMQNLRDNLAAAFNQNSGAPQLKSSYISGSMIADDQIDTNHLADDCITQDQINGDAVGLQQLKTSTGTVTVYLNGTGGGPSSASTMVYLPGASYGFYPQIKYIQASCGIGYSNYGKATITDATSQSNFLTCIQLTCIQASRDVFVNSTSTHAQQRYPTTSGEVYWIFLLRKKDTKEILASWSGPDHPCFFSGLDARELPHPFLSYNKNIHEIVVVNPSDEEVERIEDLREYKNGIPKNDFISTAFKYYELEESDDCKWPEKEVTIGKDRRQKKSIKEKIPRPNDVKLMRLKEK